MVGRYELVAVDKNKNGKIIVSKDNKKLTLQEADIFTSLFNDKNELAYYLYSKGYINEKPEMFVLLYHINKKCCFLNCLYKEDNDIITLAKSSKENNKINTYNSIFGKILSYLIRNVNSDFIEFAYNYKYINKYVYDKLIEYRYNRSNGIVKSIERELSKEYLQIRKLYSIIKIYNNLDKKDKVKIAEYNTRKVTGESNDPYIEYLIGKANMGYENAYEELKQMDLEKILSLKM